MLVEIFLLWQNESHHISKFSVSFELRPIIIRCNVCQLSNIFKTNCLSIFIGGLEVGKTRSDSKQIVFHERVSPAVANNYFISIDMPTNNKNFFIDLPLVSVYKKSSSRDSYRQDSNTYLSS